MIIRLFFSVKYYFKSLKIYIDYTYTLIKFNNLFSKIDWVIYLLGILKFKLEMETNYFIRHAAYSVLLISAENLSWKS